MSVDSVERWVAELGDARKAVQRPAAEALASVARIEPALRARIAALLTSSVERLRWGAAYTLALIEPAPLDAIPVLASVLGADDGDLRWAAAGVLVRAVAHRPEVLDVLAGLLGSASALQRKMSLYCLRDAGAVGRVPRAAFARALGDVDSSVRLAALSAVVALLPRSSETAELVVPSVEDSEAGVRRAAAATLGRLGVRVPSVLAALARAARSPDRALARAAEQALRRLDAGVG